VTVFDLPEELLYTLQLNAQSQLASTSQEATPEVASSSPQDTDAPDGPSSATSCGLCGLTFPTVLDQRSHVRSDLHGYNTKQKMRGRQAVDETEFERLMGQLDESISGSDTSGSEDDDEDDDLGSAKPKNTTLSALLKRQAKVTDGDAEDAPMRKRKRGAGKPPMIWFDSVKLPKNTTLGVYRAVLPADEEDGESTLVKSIQNKQLAAKPPPKPQPKQDAEEDGGVALPASMIAKDTSASGPHYFLCMIGGGHFAGMIVSLTPKLTKRAGVEDRTATVIAHKTFHRYTTRRKQGGSQSANDNSKGNAHSAGATIRRYNEGALEQEVRDLLTEWKPLIDSSELLFVRASGTTSRRTLFGPYDGQVLTVKDTRLRGFPFNTRRATQSELMRAFVELTRVKVRTIDEAALAKEAEEAAAAAAKAQAKAQAQAEKPSTPKAPKLTKAEEEAALHTTQIQALIRRSKAPGLVSYIQSSNLSPDFRFFPIEQNHHAPTPLHLAASSNSPACVSALLTKAGSDPTIANGDSKPPFDLAGDRATRDAFRLARSTLGEDKWSWTAANVPAPLSQTEVEARTAREKEEKASEDAAEKSRRDQEAEKLRKADANKIDQSREKKYGAGRTLVQKPALTAQERRMEDARGMTDEMRMKLERERRARAAEERIKKMQGK
jgi:hypothetical protein